MKKLQQGFTLLELMIVVAIVGILAAIAIPAYKDYIVRSKVSECAATIGACKTSVTEYYNTKNSFPSNASAAGCSTNASQYCSTLSVSSGVITSVVASTTGVGSSDCDLILGPVTGNSEITGWTGRTSCAPKYVPALFRN